MRRLIAFLAILIPVVILACGGGTASVAKGQTEDSSLNVQNESMELLAMGAPAPTAAPVAAFDVSREGSRLPTSALETAQRKVISSAFITIELEGVPEATAQVRVIAESLGGFVEQLSSSGEPQHQRATMTIRVPQDQFLRALERIEALGTVESRNIGSEDVTEQFIDLEARLKSALREEQSLLSLLEKAGVVSEILAIERELFRVRSEIERYQGQLNFLERRVALATITVSLLSPEVKSAEPPSAFLSIDVSDVSDTLARVKGLATTLDGVVERVLLSERDGKEEAEFSLRVFASGFTQGMDFLEAQGKVRIKELREGTSPVDGSVTDNEEPDSVIRVTLLAHRGSSNAALIASIAGPLGGIALAAVLGFLFFWVYRTGRRRGSAV
jgi:hypothetical protein